MLCPYCWCIALVSYNYTSNVCGHIMYMHFLGNACGDVEVGILLIQLFRGEAQSLCEGVTISADFSSCFIKAQVALQASLWTLKHKSCAGT